MSGNSAQMFYDLLKLCKSSKLANVSDEKFIRFCNTNLKAQYSSFEEAYKDAKEGINFLFPSQFPYTLAVNWQLEAYLEGGHNYRIGKGLFISDSFRAVNPKEYFQELISLFAFPMIIDRNGEHYGHNGMQNLPVADAVMDIFLSPERKGCKLQEFCRKSGIVNYDRNVCTNAPWEQCKNEYLCPVAVYFIGYSIDMKKYKWRRYKNETIEESI